MIVWDAKSIAAFRAAIKEARDNGSNFATYMGGEWTIAEAETLADRIEYTLAVPARVYPPNKEGPEP